MSKVLSMGALEQHIPEKAVLCLVEGDRAFFTTQPLEEQWGDDWDDQPYEHNCGGPYRWRGGRCEPYEIIEVRFDGPFAQPCSGHHNSPYSVRDINDNKVIPWLRGSKFTTLEGNFEIWAGAPLKQFIKLVLEAGGEVYYPASLLVRPE